MTNGKLRISLVAAVATLLAWGCASQRETMIREGYPPSYAAGFEDGCTSGRQAGGNMFEHFRKDVKRYGHDKQYSAGWGDGFRQCKAEEGATRRQFQIGIEQQKYLEQQRHDQKMENKAFEKDILKGVDTSGLETLGK